MKQIFIVGHGGPDKLQLRESPDPHPARGEIRIRVKASGVNFADILARQGPLSRRTQASLRDRLRSVRHGRRHGSRCGPVLDRQGPAHSLRRLFQTW